MIFDMLSSVYFSLISYVYIQPYLIFLFSVFCAILFITNFHYAKELCEILLTGAQNNFNHDFDYGHQKGPHKWKEMFPAARGCFQSPVNIRPEDTQILTMSEPLKWRFYNTFPGRITMENTGHTIEVKAYYPVNVPNLSGADLIESYFLVSICFRWSHLDDEGSEHSISERKYPLEMQATHISSHHSDFIPSLVGDLGIIMLSYFFIITKYDNPFLDPIIMNLQHVRLPYTKVEIPVFPISWLCYPFKSGFYSYGGSLTEPPCSEGVTWFVQPEPLAISENQLRAFRIIKSKDHMRLLRNSRPVQHLNARIVCYNRYDQSRFSQVPLESEELNVNSECPVENN